MSPEAPGAAGARRRSPDVAAPAFACSPSAAAPPARAPPRRPAPKPPSAPGLAPPALARPPAGQPAARPGEQAPARAPRARSAAGSRAGANGASPRPLVRAAWAAPALRAAGRRGGQRARGFQRPARRLRAARLPCSALPSHTAFGPLPRRRGPEAAAAFPIGACPLLGGEGAALKNLEPNASPWAGSPVTLMYDFFHKKVIQKDVILDPCQNLWRYKLMHRDRLQLHFRRCHWINLMLLIPFRAKSRYLQYPGMNLY
ncbi:uncharacterized protein J5F26_001487 [Ciconia maguari]